MEKSKILSSTFNLEKTLEEIDEIIVRLEKKPVENQKDLLGLESVIKEVEKGMALINQSQEALQHIEKKMHTLAQKNEFFMEKGAVLTSTFNLEKSLEEIEKIVMHLEKKPVENQKDLLGLESVIKEVEKGMALISQSQEALRQAEQKIRILTEKKGEGSLTKYSTDHMSGE